VTPNDVNAPCTLVVKRLWFRVCSPVPRIHMTRIRSRQPLPQTNSPDSPNDEAHQIPALVALLRRGDPNAGTRLDEAYREPLVRFCWGYLGRLDEVEDAVQEIYLKVLSADSIPDQFRPWIYKIARHHCLNLLRGRAARCDNATLPASSQIGAAMTGHLSRLAREEQHERLATLVQSLSVEQSEVLRLRYVENLSRSDIASILELPEKLVKSRLFEGIKRLRESAAQLEDT